MTTIAYQSGILVSDSRGTTGKIISDNRIKKLWPTPDGGCFAGAGNLENSMVLIDYLLDGSRGSAPGLYKDESDIIHLRPDGTLWQTSNGTWFENFDDYHAWGTGMGAALAVMSIGLDPISAVVAATRTDPFSGGALQFFALPHAKERLKQMISKAKRKGLL